MENKKERIIVLGWLLIWLILITIFTVYVIKRNDGIQNEDKEIIKIGSYNNPVIPNGFSKVETEKASWNLDKGIPKGWNSGLVIEDKIGNQFVWIPVNKITVKYEIKLESDTWDDKLPNEINNETDQIKKYGGFYIARYEAGVSDTLQSNLTNINNIKNNITGVPVSKKGVIPWNYISYKQAKENSESMYSNEYIKSGLITNTEWNTLMQWLGNSRYNLAQNCYENGNYSNINFNFTGLYSTDDGRNYQYGENESKSKCTLQNGILISCGATDRNMTNNIYDLFGNVAELTTRYGKGYCEIKGGDYYNVNGNHILKYVEPSSRIGFRVVLYMI